LCRIGDDNGKTSNINLSDKSQLLFRYIKDLIDGVTVIEGKAKTVDKNGESSLLILLQCYNDLF
jgi:hypothetical protein